MEKVQQALIERERYNKKLTEYVETIKKRSNRDKLLKFSQLRDFPLETIEQCGIFFIGSMTEMLHPLYIDDIETLGVISDTNKKPIFHDRYIIPIKTTSGLIENLVGYSSEASERYIYGASFYYRRRETLWGLENLNLAYEMGYAFITEGITDAIRLRSLGFNNTFAMCGTHSSEFIMSQLNRCRYGVIRIPDRDNPGIKAMKSWNCNRHITLLVSLHYKDIDEMCRNSDENKRTVIDAINMCIEWITQTEHRGLVCPCETITII